MPSNVATARLAEAHRLAQARLGAQTTLQMFAAWRLLDPANLDTTFGHWLLVVVPLIQRQRDMSARLAANYVSVSRTLQLGKPFPAVIAAPAPVDAITTSMLVTGPVSIKAATKLGTALNIATDNALVRASGAAMRYALDGGRDTIKETVKADPRAARWVRTVSGSACDWCSEMEGTEVLEGHDHCSCGADIQWQ